MLTDPVIDWRRATHGSHLQGDICAPCAGTFNVGPAGEQGDTPPRFQAVMRMRGSSAVCAGQCGERVAAVACFGLVCGRMVGGRLPCLSLPEFFGDLTRA